MRGSTLLSNGNHHGESVAMPGLHHLPTCKSHTPQADVGHQNDALLDNIRGIYLYLIVGLSVEPQSANHFQKCQIFCWKRKVKPALFWGSEISTGYRITFFSDQPFLAHSFKVHFSFDQSQWGNTWRELKKFIILNHEDDVKDDNEDDEDEDNYNGYSDCGDIDDSTAA